MTVDFRVVVLLVVFLWLLVVSLFVVHSLFREVSTMRAAIRTQVDDRQSEFSLETGKVFPVSEDRTKQDFKDESDVNVVLRNFGVQSLRLRPTAPIEVDWSVDLQAAYGRVLEAKARYHEMPEQIRSLYPTWEQFADAMRKGELSIEVGKGSPAPAGEPLSASGNAANSGGGSADGKPAA